MEKRLRSLKKAMDQTIFADFAFTENNRKAIHERINNRAESEEDITFAIMQLLAQERTGYDLAKLLRGRGIRNFEDNEGSLYILLHRLEQSGWIQSKWTGEDAKFYSLSDKGRKILQKAEKSGKQKRVVLKELLEG